MESQERLKMKIKIMKMERKVTTKEIADRVNLSYSHINHMISGKRVISEKNFNMIMSAIEEDK